MKKILVTGASGFIGRECIRLLKLKNFKIHAISSKDVDEYESDHINWHKVNLTDKEQIHNVFKKVKPEYLLHLAWNVSNKQYNSNQHYVWVKIGIDLLEAFSHFGGKRLVVAGTCAEYDWTDGYCYEKETPLKPQNTYGVSKHALQLLINSFSKQNQLSYAWGRIFFAYGPGENPNSLIPFVVKNLKEGKNVEISHGNFIRDYIFIEDIANAFVSLVDSQIEGPVNISSGSPSKIKDIVLKIAKQFDKEHLVKFSDKELAENDYPCIVGDNSLLLKELNWKPKIGLEEGLKRTIQSLI